MQADIKVMQEDLFVMQVVLISEVRVILKNAMSVSVSLCEQ